MFKKILSKVSNLLNKPRKPGLPDFDLMRIAVKLEARRQAKVFGLRAKKAKAALLLAGKRQIYLEKISKN